MPNAMGFVRTWLRVFAPDLSRSEEVFLLVDTGSTLTWLPEALLRGLGIQPLTSLEFRTASGEVLERLVGVAWVKLEESRLPVPVVFARPTDAVLLGVTALETLGFEVDPVTGRLKRVPYLVLASA